jgi:hypothetical protein
VRKKTEGVQRQRVLALKCEIDWRDPCSKALYQRLRDLSWDAAHYKNGIIRRKWATATGHRLPDAPEDPAKISKHWRATGKGRLSGSAYSAAEREVEGAWTRDGKKMLAGAPLSQWKTAESLSIRGHKAREESGVRLEFVDGQYFVMLQAQAATCEGGSWLRVPVARGSEKDWQRTILDGMCAWSVPIRKATAHLKQHKIILRLTYEVESAKTSVGDRVATLGPVTSTGGLFLRVDNATVNYSHKIGAIGRRKEDWELIRRRALRQIGWRKGHARIKREVLSRMTWDNWLDNHLHTWSREVAAFCDSQKASKLQVIGIDTGDWPAYRFTERLKYKCQEYGIEVAVGIADESAASLDRAVGQEIKKAQRDVKRRRIATTEVTDQFTKRTKTA